MTSLIAIAVCVGLIWGAVFLFRAPLWAGCLAFLIVGGCFGYGFWSESLGPIPLTADRIVLVGLVGMCAVHYRLGRADLPAIGGVGLLLALFVAYLTASLLLTDWTNADPKVPHPAFRLVWGYMVPVAVYFVARSSRFTDRGLRVLFAVAMVLGVYLSLTAFCEVAGQWWLVFPKHIADPKVGIHFGRARGPMVQSCVLGMYLTVALLSAWLWLPQLGRRGRLLLCLLMPLYLAAIFVTYTRAVWLGAALALFNVLALSLRGLWRPLVLGSMVAVGLTVTVAKWDSLLGFQRDISAKDTRDSAYSRVQFAYLSWLMFQDRPITGFGFGQYQQGKMDYIADRSADIYLGGLKQWLHHNTFLSLLTETGLIGLGLFLAILCGFARNAWQVWHADGLSDMTHLLAPLLLGVLGMYLWSLLTYEVSYTSLETSFVFFLAGLTGTARAQAARQPAAAAVANRLPSALLPATS